MKRVVLCAVAMLCCVLPIAAIAQMLLTIKTVDPSLIGRPVLLDGEFVGLVGDTVPLDPKTTQIGVLLPQGFYATMAVRTTVDGFAGNPPYGGECVGSTVWNIRNGLAPRFTGNRPHLTVEIPAIAVVGAGSCSNEPSELACRQTYAQIDVSAVPEVHADIWVAGKDIHMTTPGTVSFPFCIGMTPRMAFVLRKTGFTNCAVAIRADTQPGPYAARCTLEEVAH